jgi:catechol 2,3-dioxygenase-like lactoylglutathione lyase family enzyme
MVMGSSQSLSVRGSVAPMPRLTLAIAVLVLASCATHAPASAPATTAVPIASHPTLLRSALIVADADRSIAFYALLGFQVESDTGQRTRRTAGNPFPLNAASNWSRLVILASATGSGGRIGLVEFGDPPPPQRRDSNRLVGRGDLVLVFDVTDADAIHEALRRGGADIHETPQVYVSVRQAADGRQLRGKVFHTWDPDGNLIELLEAPK